MLLRAVNADADASVTKAEWRTYLDHARERHPDSFGEFLNLIEQKLFQSQDRLAGKQESMARLIGHALPQEDASKGTPKVRIRVASTPGVWIRKTGFDIQQGQVVHSRGERFTPAAVGVAATVGRTEALVYRRPVVAVVSTGNELVAEDSSSLPPGKIRDSNRSMLLAAVSESGAVAVDMGITGDEAGRLEETLVSALGKADIVVTTGGVSMGELDLMKVLLEKLGKIHFGRLKMKPGKPTTFATAPHPAGQGPDRLLFALPGNPVSALVCFHLFVSPTIGRLQGDPSPGPLRVVCRLAAPIKLDAERPEYHRATLRWGSWGAGGGFLAQSTGVQQSSRLLSFGGADALLELPKGPGVIERGAEVFALLLRLPKPQPPGDKSADPTPEAHASHAPALVVGEAAVKVARGSLQGGVAVLRWNEEAAAASQLVMKMVLDAGVHLVAVRTLSGDAAAGEEAAEALRGWCEQGVSLILTCGGAGLEQGDYLPDIARSLIAKEAPGLVAAPARGVLDPLYRGAAGVAASGTVILNLAGTAAEAAGHLRRVLPAIANTY